MGAREVATDGSKETQPVLRYVFFEIAVWGHVYSADHPFAVSMRQRIEINSRDNQTVHSGKYIWKNRC